MTDALVHWVRTQQDANVPLVQLQDPTQVRGPALLIVTDEQRASLWSAANREHDRLQRGMWQDRGWARLGITTVLISSLLGGVASVLAVLHK